MHVIRAALISTVVSGGAQIEERAIPERTIKAECRAAGGTYSTSTAPNGDRTSSCRYTDNSGHVYGDIFRNGKYLGTL